MTRALKNAKNVHFNWLLWTKAYDFWANKVERDYAWWNWRLMQNLSENWLVLPKMTWRIWQIFTRALKSLKIGNSMGLYIQSRKKNEFKCISVKFTGVLCLMTMNNDAKFEVELSCQFKIDIMNLMNFDPNTQKSHNLHFNGLLLTKVYHFWANQGQRNYAWWHWRLMQNL